MGARPVGTKTIQLGWRFRVDLIEQFKEWCAEERKDPVLELEYMISCRLWEAKGKKPQRG